MASPAIREADYVTEISCHTRVEVNRFTCTWTIHDFSFRREENGKAITSDSFSTARPGGERWCLQLYPNGKDKASEGFVSLYLHKVSQKCFTADLIEYKFSVICEGGQKAGEQKGTSDFWPGLGWGFPKFIERNCLLQSTARLLPNDKLTVRCEVLGIVTTVNTSSQAASVVVQVPDCHLPQDFGQLLESGESSDVVFEVQGREIRAHKLILAARSPVFAAMFEHKVKENEKGRVEIADCGFDVFREVVEFLYTGRAPKLDGMAKEVLVAADKYDLGRLKAMCERVLSSNITVDVAAEVLALADMHNADQLKASAVCFIKAHASGVIETAGWKILASDKPHLVAEVLRALTV